MKTCSVCTAALALLLALPAAAMKIPESATRNRVEIALPTFEISPFCKAIMQGEMETVKKMIALGEDVNRKSLGKTPLIFAARYNRAEIVALLLDNGADPKLRCDKGHTALDHAELSNAHEAAAVLRNAMKS